ncbi:MAG: PDDEXK nuclease domain-containing protein [Thermoplasmatales archaeon]|nr:PDDEXK nuclease domain-containing protein [Thermoplasmatales archaeon]
MGKEKVLTIQGKKIERLEGYNEILSDIRTYPIIQTVSEQLSWSHFVELTYINDKVVRDFYEKQAIQNRWSVRELRKQIHSKLIDRIKKEGKLVAIKPLPLKVKCPEDIFKDTYNFEFLKLSEAYSENKLKTVLLNQLEKFLHELGEDFFIGRREVPILIGGNYDRVDLELFHAGLLCYILVEVKTEKFKHSHVALGDLKKEIFVAEYKLKLPSEREIKKRLKNLKLKSKGGLKR